MEKTKLLILRVTERCNLACRYCYAAKDSCVSPEDSGASGDMALETAMAAVSLFAESGGKLKIQFTGGEPLLCFPLIEEIVAGVKRMGIQAAYSIQTNATLFTRERCAKLKAMRFAVGVSLDGMGEANGLRVFPDGTNSFDASVNGIRLLALEGIGCNINAVVTNKSQAGLSGLVELAAYLHNVKGIGLDMFRPLGRGQESGFAPNRESLANDLLQMLKTRERLEQLGVKIRIKELDKVRFMLSAGVFESCYCYAQTGLSAAVDRLGDIYPCSSFVGDKRMLMGNVMRQDADWKTVPTSIAGPGQDCENCPERGICRGGCPAGRAACSGTNECDCVMHRTLITYGRNEYETLSVPH